MSDERGKTVGGCEDAGRWALLDADGRLLHASAGLTAWLDTGAGPGCGLADWLDGLPAGLSPGAGAVEIPSRFEARTRSGEPVRGLVVPVPVATGTLLAVDFEAPRPAGEAGVRAAALSELLLPLGHDFNNLFSIVIGSLDLLEEPDTEGEEARSLLADAASAAHEGARTIEKLLAFAGRQVLRPSPVDLAPLVESLVGLARRSLPDSVRLDLRAAHGAVHARADPARTEAAVLELLANAREAMPEGGTISIQVLAPGPASGGARVGVRVGDDGPGMAPGDLERAREPFFTTRRPRRGRGFGLSTVHGFARQSGGELVLESAVGTGTRATLYLPGAGPDM